MKRALSIFLCVLFLVSVAACGTKTTNDSGNTSALPSVSPSGTSEETPEASAPDSSDGPVYGGVLKVVSTAEGATNIGMPWGDYAIGPTDSTLNLPVQETLMNQNRDGSYECILAESYELDTENNQVVFKLREGVKFHDGSDFNAEVAKWNIDMMKEKAKTTPSYDECKVLGPYEIAIHYPNGLTNSATTGWVSRGSVMISKEAYEKNGEEWMAENPIGTGPFKFVEYSKGSYITFTKFEDYWKEGLPYLDGIKYLFIKDTMTQNIALQTTGEEGVDLLNTTAGDQISTFKQQGYGIYSVALGPMCLMPSSIDENSPFAKLEVRQALSYALDRDAIVAARGFGVWTPAYQINAPGIAGHNTDTNFGVPRYDPEKAKELLAQAGYPDGFKTVLIGQTGLADKDAMVAIQSQLAAIGIEAEVELPDAGGYAAMRQNGWDGILVQSNRNLPAQETSYKLLYDTARNYFFSILHPQEMQDRLDEAYSKLGDVSAELNELQASILDQAITIPIYFTYDSWIMKPTVHNYAENQTKITEIWLSEK